MSKKGGTDYLEPVATEQPEYMTGNGAEAEDVTSLEDYLTKKPPKFVSEVIGGRRYWFKSGSPKAKDALLAKHSKDDGMGNVSVDQTMWRTDAIALTWVTGPNGGRVLNSADAAERFHAQADADDELAMYAVAARMLGLKESEAKDAARKNSPDGGGTSTSLTTPSTTSTLYPASS
jgi:hypothetical protein